jgi:hypothetical protein
MCGHNTNYVDIQMGTLPITLLKSNIAKMAVAGGNIPWLPVHYNAPKRLR